MEDASLLDVAQPYAVRPVVRRGPLCCCAERKGVLNQDGGMPDFEEWIGVRRTTEERLDPTRAAALAATLERPAPVSGDALPPLWHWIHFWAPTVMSELGPDGHARRGGFLPPVDLPHRMWAGGRLRFDAPLRLGATARRTAEIHDVRSKQGRSGPLVFVTVRFEITDDQGGALVEEQDIVYRGSMVGNGVSADRARPGTWRRHVAADPILLFRYSALTFNGHRIHYDRPYAIEHEGYPGLVVHGPLLATWLMDLARHEAGLTCPSRFEFRARRPVFDTAAFTLNAARPDGVADRVSLWVADTEGYCAMTAEARGAAP